MERGFAAQQRAGGVGQAQRVVALVVHSDEFARDQLAEDRAPALFVQIAADAESGDVLVAAFDDLVGQFAAQHVDQVPCAVALAGAVDQLSALRAASVASQVCGGFRQLSQLPQGPESSPK